MEGFRRIWAQVDGSQGDLASWLLSTDGMFMAVVDRVVSAIEIAVIMVITRATVERVGIIIPGSKEAVGSVRTPQNVLARVPVNVVRARPAIHEIGPGAALKSTVVGAAIPDLIVLVAVYLVVARFAGGEVLTIVTVHVIWPALGIHPVGTIIGMHVARDPIGLTDHVVGTIGAIARSGAADDIPSPGVHCQYHRRCTEG